MIATLAPADRAQLGRLGEALHRAAALGDRRWAAFPIVRSCVAEAMSTLRPHCDAADVEEVAHRLVGVVDYRSGYDSMFELALTEVCAHGLAWSWERC
ncbi:hypothetical protein [Methylocystis rosea]|uniref:Uncharacterized protein n=1 Tax=Methylocystis rosea TaxID=173366 RepID=A0A3G8M623_9HYPH|nr:hypothetical protein [Methylocystis rosea]AZG76328.1 hypothetical protein EHO51_06070 [Methylocystis rosea]